MFRKLMIPVDIGVPEETLDRTFAAGAGLAQHFGADVVIVHVTESKSDDATAATRQDIAAFDRLVERQCEIQSFSFESKRWTAENLGKELDELLPRIVEDLNVDLVVMASHAWSLTDMLFGSHGRSLVLRAETSVLLIR